MERRGMTFLLDTHTVLWALTSPSRLGPEARRVVSSGSSVLSVSAASAWEISTKHRLGKLPQADSLLGGYSQHLQRLGVVHMPISEQHALLAGALSWSHRDPFDRMLAAQAMSEALTLISRDAVFSELNGVRVLW